MSDDAERWNHNIHHHPTVLSALPPGARRAADLGCGEGVLARKLRARVGEVVAVDRDAASIEEARRRDPDGTIDHRCADLLAVDLAPASFDLVASVAALHHLDARAGLARMRELVRPGGRLVVVGLARSRLPADLGWELAGTAVHWWHRRRRPLWHSPAPVVWPPPLTYRAMRALVRELLPGARFRRHPTWRYTVVWTAP